MRRFKILRSTGSLLSWLICCALGGAPVWAQQETGDSGAGGGASMEAEAVDSSTNKRIAAVVETAKGNRLWIGAGLSRLGHAKQVIDGWIERFVKRLDQARTRKTIGPL